MSKITLGQTPKTYAPVAVKFPMPDGSDGVIQCTFTYRTRKQFGELQDSVGAKPLLPEGGGDAKPVTVADIINAAVEKNGGYLVQVLSDWSLDEELTLETATQLADELPAAAEAIANAYTRAVTEGRLGN